MTTLLYTHRACLEHDPGQYHPEAPARLRAVLSALEGQDFRLGFTRQILPALDAFRPEMLLISAGFDAHRSDPLAQLLLDESDYTWVTEQLLAVAHAHAGGRVVSALEGGYDLHALGASVAAHLRVLMSV